MRITFEIDDDGHQAAKEIAAVRRQTIGKVISELARVALNEEQPASASKEMPFVTKDGRPVMPNRGGIVTDELAQRLLDEADWEDAGLKNG
jgi:hypothetical protein